MDLNDSGGLQCRAVHVWWRNEEKWFPGTLRKFLKDSMTYTIFYEDGDTEEGVQLPDNEIYLHSKHGKKVAPTCHPDQMKNTPLRKRKTDDEEEPAMKKQRVAQDLFKVEKKVCDTLSHLYSGSLFEEMTPVYVRISKK